MRTAVTAALIAASLPVLPVYGEAQSEPARPPIGVIVAKPSPAPSPRAVLPVYPTASERAARAQANLAALRDGRRAVSDLTPQELEDVRDFDRMLRGEGPDQRTFVEQCVDQEVSRLGRPPSRLDLEVIRLKCR
ncbi:MAG: hypothetical protein GC147_04810 [Porphyrobacter sp.]|nr:hypothetical protein [Porphyrobacter sp.]